jgi:putative FmdB family regulatory protein
VPIYEFRCTKCNRNFDVTRPREKAGAPAKCPHDGAPGQRLFTAAIALGAASSSFDDFDFGGDDMEGMGGMPGMPDMGGMDDLDF